MTQSQRVTRSDGVRGQVVLHGDHIAFLGLVSAHYDIPTLAETTEELPGRVSTRLNAGISAITPSHFILELLNRADVAEQRSEVVARSMPLQGIPTMDISESLTEGDL